MTGRATTLPGRTTALTARASEPSATTAGASEPSATLSLGGRLGLGAERGKGPGAAFSLEADANGVRGSLLAGDLVPSLALKVLHAAQGRLAQRLGSGGIGEESLVEDLFAGHGRGG